MPMAHRPETSRTKPRIAVVGTGGTLAWSVRGRLEHGSYFDAGEPMTLGEVLALLPEAFEIADLEPVEHARVGSTALTTADLLRLGELVATLARSGVDGIVVTHGTATLEETAFFLALTRPSDVPVVVVGAQRPTGLLGSDALLNLLAGIRVASDPTFAVWGAVVCLDGTVHDGFDVEKLHTTALDAFRSRRGPVGRLLPDGMPSLDRAPAGTRVALPVPAGIADLPRVDVAVSYLGSDGAAIRAFRSAGAAGIVVAGLVPGMCTPWEEEAMIDALDDGVAIVQSTRSGAGVVLVPRRLRERGVIAGGDLAPSKARVLTAVALAARLSRDELAAIFLRC